MALADFAAYKAAIESPKHSLTFESAWQGYFGSVFGRLSDLWFPTSTSPVTPSSPVALSAADSHIQEKLPSLSTGTHGIVGARTIPTSPLGSGAGVFVIDRLCHQGGLSGIATGAQTTNLPTAALPRYTDGVGVMMGLSVIGQVGATSRTVTVTYTNHEGVGSRVSPAVRIGGNTFRELGRFFILPLQTGDRGVRSVESVTLNASTGVVGNFGVVLFRPLYVVPIRNNLHPRVDSNLLDGNGGGGVPAIPDDACLSFLSSQLSFTGLGGADVAGTILVGEW